MCRSLGALMLGAALLAGCASRDASRVSIARRVGS